MEVTPGCRHHATREKMVPLGQGWVHRPMEDSDECWHKDHKGEKCDGKNERCKDYAEKVIPE
jgi:hypothetical protein